MEHWESLIDRQIKNAIGDGQMSDLPGAGKPLQLGEDATTPPELRMAYKLLKDNDLVPDWIMMGRELDEQRETLLKSLLTSAQMFVANKNSDSLTRARAYQTWETKQKTIRQQAEQLNKQITTYNLKVPVGVTHKLPVNIDREITRALNSL